MITLLTGISGVFLFNYFLYIYISFVSFLESSFKQLNIFNQVNGKAWFFLFQKLA